MQCCHPPIAPSAVTDASNRGLGRYGSILTRTRSSSPTVLTCTSRWPAILRMLSSDSPDIQSVGVRRHHFVAVSIWDEHPGVAHQPSPLSSRCCWTSVSWPELGHASVVLRAMTSTPAGRHGSWHSKPSNSCVLPFFVAAVVVLRPGIDADDQGRAVGECSVREAQGWFRSLLHHRSAESRTTGSAEGPVTEFRNALRAQQRLRTVTSGYRQSRFRIVSLQASARQSLAPNRGKARHSPHRSAGDEAMRHSSGRTSITVLA